MKMYRIVYRLKGVIDFVFCLGKTPDEALSEFHGRIHGRIVRVSQTGCYTGKTDNVVYVDFKAKQRKAS